MTTRPLDHFQVMRGIACLMVVFNHLGGLMLDGAPGHFDAWYVPLLMPTGFQWVWMFLALSGFLLTKAFTLDRFSLDRMGILAFYVARAKRLFPLLWAAGIFWLLLYFCLHPFGLWPTRLPSWDWKREVSIAFALPWLPYIESLNPIASVNSPVWSAIIEVHYCVLMPLLLIWFGKPKHLTLVLSGWIILMIALLLSVIGRESPTIFPGIYGAHLYNAGFFMAGMLVAKLSPIRFAKEVNWIVVSLVVGAAMIAAQYVAFYDVNLALAISPFFVLPAVCLLIAKADDNYQAKLPDTFHRLITVSWSPLSWLERIGITSYSVYLLHKPIGYVFLQDIAPITAVGDLARYPLMLLAALIPILVITSCFYIFVENKFRRKSPRLS